MTQNDPVKINVADMTKMDASVIRLAVMSRNLKAELICDGIIKQLLEAEVYDDTLCVPISKVESVTRWDWIISGTWRQA